MVFGTLLCFYSFLVRVLPAVLFAQLHVRPPCAATAMTNTSSDGVCVGGGIQQALRRHAPYSSI